MAERRVAVERGALLHVLDLARWAARKNRANPASHQQFIREDEDAIEAVVSAIEAEKEESAE